MALFSLHRGTHKLLWISNYLHGHACGRKWLYRARTAAVIILRDVSDFIGLTHKLGQVMEITPISHVPLRVSHFILIFILTGVLRL